MTGLPAIPPKAFRTNCTITPMITRPTATDVRFGSKPEELRVSISRPSCSQQRTFSLGPELLVPAKIERPALGRAPTSRAHGARSLARVTPWPGRTSGVLHSVLGAAG